MLSICIGFDKAISKSHHLSRARAGYRGEQKFPPTLSTTGKHLQVSKPFRHQKQGFSLRLLPSDCKNNEDELTFEEGVDDSEIELMREIASYMEPPNITISSVECDYIVNVTCTAPLEPVELYTTFYSSELERCNGSWADLSSDRLSPLNFSVSLVVLSRLLFFLRRPILNPVFWHRLKTTWTYLSRKLRSDKSVKTNLWFVDTLRSTTTVNCLLWSVRRLPVVVRLVCELMDESALRLNVLLCSYAWVWMGMECTCRLHIPPLIRVRSKWVDMFHCCRLHSL